MKLDDLGPAFVAGVGLTLGYVLVNYVFRNTLHLSYPAETLNSIRPSHIYSNTPIGNGPEYYRGFSSPVPTWAGGHPRGARVAYRYTGDSLTDIPMTSATPAPPHSGVEPYTDIGTDMAIYSGDPMASRDLIEDPSLQTGLESAFNFEDDGVPTDTT